MAVERMNPSTLQASNVIAALAVPVVLWIYLLATVFSGLAVYVLTVKNARRLPANWGRFCPGENQSVQHLAYSNLSGNNTADSWSSFAHDSGSYSSDFRNGSTTGYRQSTFQYDHCAHQSRDAGERRASQGLNSKQRT